MNSATDLRRRPRPSISAHSTQSGPEIEIVWVIWAPASPGSSRCSCRIRAPGKCHSVTRSRPASSSATRCSWVPPFFIFTGTVAPTSSSPAAVAVTIRSSHSGHLAGSDHSPHTASMGARVLSLSVASNRAAR